MVDPRAGVAVADDGTVVTMEGGRKARRAQMKAMFGEHATGVRDMLEECFNQVYGRVPAKNAKDMKKEAPYNEADPLAKTRTEFPELLGKAGSAEGLGVLAINRLCWQVATCCGFLAAVGGTCHCCSGCMAV